MKRTDVRIDTITVGERPVSEQAVTMSESHRPITIIPIDEIVVKDDQVNQDVVQALVISIGQLGLFHPIGVSRDGILIFGRHRLEACRQLGWKTITAAIYDWDTITAEMAAIDENICHRVLSAAEEVQLLARRKELYLALYPQSGHGKAPGTKGGKGGKPKGGKDAKMASFVDDTAKKTGKSKRSVQRDAAIGAALPEEVMDLLVGTKISKKDLGTLATLDPQVQMSIATMLSNGEIDSVSEALQDHDEPATAPEPSEVLVRRLRPVIDRWMREFDASAALAASVLESLTEILLSEA